MSQTIQVNEHSSGSYGPRTYFNAVNSDVTCAIVINLDTAGERLTRKAAGAEKYISFEVGFLTDDNQLLEYSRELYRFCKKRKCKVLNIAGNGIYTWSKYGWTQEEVNSLVLKLLKPVIQYTSITTIASGGQTGTDIAGLNAGHKLGLDLIATLPKGYLQRDKSGTDKTNTKESIIEQIRI
jgi:hypothetical protein